MHSPSSLVSQILKVKYFLHGTILEARLGHRLSFTWRNILDSPPLIESGTRSLVGNGAKIHVWTNKWIPRPFSFTPLFPDTAPNLSLLVADLIEFNDGCWKEDSVRAIFKPCDVDYILNIPLCHLWPNDKITWHFTTTGEFKVRSAYHLARALKTKNNPTTSRAPGASLWKSL